MGYPFEEDVAHGANNQRYHRHINPQFQYRIVADPFHEKYFMILLVPNQKILNAQVILMIWI